MRKSTGQKTTSSRRRRVPLTKKPVDTARRRARAQGKRDSPGPGAGLSGANIMVFLATADAVRARTFYESVVGLRFVADDPFALVFDANGVMVRIQKVATVTPASYTALGWVVADIARTVESLRAHGVEAEKYDGLAQDALGVWASPSGAHIAWFRDPDGHILSLTQW